MISIDYIFNGLAWVFSLQGWACLFLVIGVVMVLFYNCFDCTEVPLSFFVKSGLILVFTGTLASAVEPTFFKNGVEGLIFNGHIIIFLLMTVLLTMLMGARILNEMLDRMYLVRWWAHQRCNKFSPPETWQEVLETMEFDSNSDPTKIDKSYYIYMPLWHRVVWVSLIIYIADIYAYVIEALLITRASLVKYHLPAGMENYAIFGTILAAIIAGIVAIYIATYNQRIKVSQENRQKWINEVRSTSVEVIKGITSIFFETETESTFTTKSQENNKDWLGYIEGKYFELECLLNPSEKDHRLIMVLIRTAIVPHKTRKDIKYDTNIINDINENITDCDKKRFKDILDILDLRNREDDDISGKTYNTGGIVRIISLPENSPVYKNIRENFLSYIIILSQVILKREWERVRSGE